MLLIEIGLFSIKKEKKKERKIEEEEKKRNEIKQYFDL